MPTDPHDLIEVLKPGLATSVQDMGRQGCYHVGIPPSGSLDQYASRAANLLVGNPEEAAVLECTLLGPELLFHMDALIAVTGAEMTPKIDGIAHSCDVALRIRAGSVLSFQYVKAGARAYLAVAGGIDVPVVLGSRSTYTLGAIGGLAGRRLQKGDRLPVGAVHGAPREGRELPASMRRPLDSQVALRVLTGLYHHRLTDGRRRRSSTTSGPSRPRRTASATATRTGGRCSFGRANSRSARARIRRTSSTRAIRSARSRCRPGSSRSSCIAMRSPAAATRPSARSSAPTWT
jgi:hypothetical protein